jgi:hypothetical protein
VIANNDTNTIFVLANVNLTVTLPTCAGNDGKKVSFLIPGATVTGGPTQTYARASGSSDQLVNIYSAGNLTSYGTNYPAIAFICSSSSGTPTWYFNEGTY